MGLDMYLNRKFYISRWEGKSDPAKRWAFTIRRGGKKTNIPTDKIKIIETEEVYWRKANAIHAWFVKNVQDGKDDCGDYEVDRDQLVSLLDTVKRVLKSTKLIPGQVHNGDTFKEGKITPIIEQGRVMKDPSVAEQLLPSKGGFFFGGTDYDEGYWADLLHTKKELTRILAEKEDFNSWFVYHSSW